MVGKANTVCLCNATEVFLNNLSNLYKNKRNRDSVFALQVTEIIYTILVIDALFILFFLLVIYGFMFRFLLFNTTSLTHREILT